MNELFGPIIGITLVLMSGVLPAAFIPGLTGQMFAQFRAGDRDDRVPQRRQRRHAQADTMRAVLAAAGQSRRTTQTYFSAPSTPCMIRSALYTRLIGGMIARSGLMCVIALIVIGAAGYGLSRVATGFLPIEDQGYVMVTVRVAGRRLAYPHEARARPGRRDRRQESPRSRT